MFRFIAILLVSILLITLLKSIIGVIMRGFSDLLQSGGGAPAAGGTEPSGGSDGRRIKARPRVRHLRGRINLREEDRPR